jgi:hypothetical protein
MMEMVQQVVAGQVHPLWLFGLVVEHHVVPVGTVVLECVPVSLLELCLAV